MLISTNITLEIAELNVTPDERMHLLSLVDANIHSSVVSTVLENLSEHDKKIFLQNLSNDDHEKTWDHLKEKIEDAEDKIQKTIEETVRELLEDVRKVRHKKLN